jgi:hypothetical protein
VRVVLVEPQPDPAASEATGGAGTSTGPAGSGS